MAAAGATGGAVLPAVVRAGCASSRVPGSSAHRSGGDDPGGADESEQTVASEQPAIKERAVYLNIGHSFPPLTVNDWSAERWQEYLDCLTAARFNSIHFCVWQDYLSDFAAAAEDKDRNRQLHERLQRFVAMARGRAFHVAFYLAPTFGPHVVWEAHPELLAEIDYVRHGFLSLCPSRAESWPLIRSFLAHELAWFSDVDAVQIWFYDPGGCLCARCREDYIAPLVRQVETCGELVRNCCPRAELRVSTWPIWAWEHQLQHRYGVDFLDALARLPASCRPAAVFDSAQRDDSFLVCARERGFRTHAFFFSANVESPFVFFNPHFTFFRTTADRVAGQGHDGAVIHSIEAGAKWLDTWIAGQFLGRPETEIEAAARAAAQFVTGLPATVQLLAPALIEWHDCLRRGVRGNEFSAVRRAIEQAVATLPQSRQQELDWLTSSARAIDVICRAAACEEPPAALRGEFRDVLAASVTFHGFAARSDAVLPQLARLVRRGWDTEHF